MYRDETVIGDTQIDAANQDMLSGMTSVFCDARRNIRLFKPFLYCYKLYAKCLSACIKSNCEQAYGQPKSI